MAEHAAVELSEVKADLVDIEAAKNSVDASGAKTCDIFEHKLTHEQLATTLETSLDGGLTEAEALIRHERDGPNSLTPVEGVWWFWKAVAHVAGGFSLLLWAGSVMCFAVYGVHGAVADLTLGIVLAVVVTATGIFSYYQEVKSDNVLASLLEMAPDTCYVKRDGEWKHTNATVLVKGDVVKLENGKKVPADVIVLMSHGVKVDNSSLTGESEPIKRITECTDADRPTSSKNVAFYGTNIVEGAGLGVVVRIGDHTTMGKIAASVQLTEKPEALMKAEIERFVHIITFIALTIGLIFFIFAATSGYKILDAIVFTIGIIVANVPEGLLATVTVALTITAERMAEKKVLVKSTLIVETLGSITCIASDKTGTLTQNRMSVRNAIYPDGTVRVTQHPRRRSIKEEPVPLKMSAEDEPFRPYYTRLIEIAAICNHANFDERNVDILQRTTDGDASESALLKFAHSNANSDEIRKTYDEVACVSFNSTNKFMVTIHTIKDSSDYRVCIKGAPERVMGRCSSYTDTKNGKVNQLTPEIRDAIVESNTKLAKNGERVLAFGQQIIKGFPAGFEFETENIDKCNFPMDGFEFAGMLSLEDPPREQVPAAVQSCHEASITVIMVTGDHPLTGRSIAAQIGILSEADGGQNTPIYDTKADPAVRNDESKTGVVVIGDQLAELGDADWDYILTRKGIVFARTLPTQKQDIVERLQNPDGLDHVVSVTGDGVNDSPALKAARVGIAMGSGSEVAKEAADLILLDDDFSSIVKGIEEGRLIFSNLKKSIAYTLTSNIPEIIPFLAQIVFKMPLGMTTIMILCVDLGTDILPAISFAYETSESDIMRIPPRDRHNDKLVTGTLISFSYLQIGIIQAMCAFTVFFENLKRAGYTTDFILNGKAGFDWSNDEATMCFENSKVVGGCATFAERSFHLREAQTAFLASIVMCQIGCGLACKTRLASTLTHGMHNMVFNCGVLQESSLIVILVYVPFIQSAFNTENLGIEDWLVALPFSIFLFAYDECRKLWMRSNPNHWFKEWLYY
jgi:sodium/potassium-transporting ATPase subunit alpha